MLTHCLNRTLTPLPLTRLVITGKPAQLLVELHQAVISFLVGSIAEQLTFRIIIVRPVDRSAVLLKLVQDLGDGAKLVMSCCLPQTAQKVIADVKICINIVTIREYL